MVGSKDHINVSTSNIIKPTLEAFLANDQQPFDDLVRRKEKEVLRKLIQCCEKAKEKYISYFMVDRHQKIIHQGEINMESLLPSSQAPTISILDQYFKAFIEQQEDQLKQYIDELLKDRRIRMKIYCP
jgi:antitoxin component of RelBE/YafQ-DinJ toxin-antitoxin module